MTQEHITFRTTTDFAHRLRAFAEAQDSSVAVQLRAAAEAHLLLGTLAALHDPETAREMTKAEIRDYETRVKNELGRIWLAAFPRARDAFESEYARLPAGGHFGHVAVPFERLPAWLLRCVDETDPYESD
jgi:hypothetical protein